MADDRDYEVGYRKPPLHSRFPPGQSGNPKGRKKGSRGLKADLEAELKSIHTIRINQEPVTGTKQRLAIKALATRAATGDLKAIAQLVPLIVQIFGIEDRGVSRKKLSPQDEAILRSLLEDESGPGETHASELEAADINEQLCFPPPTDVSAKTDGGDGA